MAEEIKKDDELINPSDIIFTEDDDADMPVPETTKYENKSESNNNKVLHPTVLFIKLFEECMGKLPYASVLKNQSGDQIKLVDLVKFVEAKTGAMPVSDMNTILSFVSNCPLEHVRPLMDMVNDSPRQKELWTF